MTGEASCRKPSTSSGPLPPIQTVAPKLSRSCLPLPTSETVMPQEGSGTMSGRTDAGGSAIVGTLAGSSFRAVGRNLAPWPAKPAGTGAGQQPPGPQQPELFTTSTVTVAEA